MSCTRRVWVLDRGIASEANLKVLRERKQSYLASTPRSRLREFEVELCMRDCSAIRALVQIKSVIREGQTRVLARSTHRQLKEKATRKRPSLGLHHDLRSMPPTVQAGRLKEADTVLERIGRLRERGPAASRFAAIEVQRRGVNRHRLYLPIGVSGNGVAGRSIACRFLPTPSRDDEITVSWGLALPVGSRGPPFSAA